MQNFIDFKNITRLYPGIRALDAVDFSLQEGEIHCLVGENGSGKSTLIKIISGVAQPEPGAHISVKGRKIVRLDAREALRLGIRVIYQDLALFPNLTVKENIAFGLYEDSKGAFVQWKTLGRRAQEAMDMIGLDLDINRQVSSLSIAEQQQVEIARSITGELELLILDEPTASLTRIEVDKLFATIQKLQKRGISTLFVSHKLNEIFEIAERVTVLRDGKKIGIYKPSELDQKKLVYLMTGQSMEVHPPEPLDPETPDLLQVNQLSKKGNYKDVSFTLKRGEILGIIGRLGSGRTELALSLFGMNPPESGSIYLKKQLLRLKCNADAVRRGIALVPENRHTEGIVMPQSILYNITLSVLTTLLGAFGLLNTARRRETAKTWIEKLRVKIPTLFSAVQTLSGGNQQKVVLAKWLATRPKLLILDEPTVGIDVVAKNSVHDLVKDLAKEGLSIILISDEVHEVLSNCHRVLVMDGGRILEEITPGPDAQNILLERYNLA